MPVTTFLNRIEFPADSFLIINAVNDIQGPKILAPEVDEMPEQKMVERKKDIGAGKESKNLREDTDMSETGSARKEAGFMEEEKQGLKSGEKGKLSREGSKANFSEGRTGTKESSRDIGERSGRTGGLDTEKRLQEEGASHSAKSHEESKADVSHEKKSTEKDTSKNR